MSCVALISIAAVAAATPLVPIPSPDVAGARRDRRAGHVLVQAIGTVALLLLSASTLRAQPPRTVWDGVYTDAQAERGREIFTTSCLRCHGPVVDGVPARFTSTKFWGSWGEDALSRLYDYLRQSMPNDSPGSLTAPAYVDVVAFIVAANGAPSGAGELTAADMAMTRLTKRSGDGSVPEGAFVTVIGCLTKVSDGWAITRGSAPQRARGADVGADLASATSHPLGETTIRLLFPTGPLDRLAGQKVLARGLLVRRPSDGVNLMDVRSVAPACE